MGRAERRRRVVCYTCNTQGHYALECPKRGGGGGRKGGGRDGGASAKQVFFSFSAKVVFPQLTPAGETAPQVPGGAAVAAAVVADPNAWVLDSGASHHMAKDRDEIEDYEATPGVMFKMADGSIAPAEGKGNMKITTSRGTTMVLKSTLYAL